MSQVTDQLASSIKGAELAELKTGASEETEEDSFADLVVDIKEGNATSHEVDERVTNLLNDLVDIPYVPEAIEGKLLGFAVDAVKTALVQIVERLAE
jgi:hypothetical protein